MRVVKPPENLTKFLFMPPVGESVFLSGSIEMGKAYDWQKLIEQSFKDEKGILFNPRRDDWDSTWKQSENEPKFVEQVEWELTALEMADTIAVHLEPDTMAPITLLEIGLYAKLDPSKMVIHCPEGYWRKGNIDVLCNKYNIRRADSWETFIGIIRHRIREQ